MEQLLAVCYVTRTRKLKIALDGAAIVSPILDETLKQLNLLNFAREIEEGVWGIVVCVEISL